MYPIYPEFYLNWFRIFYDNLKTSQELQKLPNTSYLDSNVNVDFVCPVSPVDHGNLDDHDFHGDHDDRVDHKTSYSLVEERWR